MSIGLPPNGIGITGGQIGPINKHENISLDSQPATKALSEQLSKAPKIIADNKFNPDSRLTLSQGFLDSIGKLSLKDPHIASLAGPTFAQLTRSIHPHAEV
jgi:hypothetical protein